MFRYRFSFVAPVAGFVLLVMSWGQVAASERLKVEVRETGGWSRPIYPCTLTLDRPTSPAPLRFRLIDESSRPIVVQADAEVRGKITRWWLAFPVSLKPHQRRVLTLELGPDVTPGPRRSRGHVLEVSGKQLRIVNAPYLVWTLPTRVGPFLQSLEFGNQEHLAGPTAHLVIKTRSGRTVSLGGPDAPSWKPVRRGPLAVTLSGEQSVVVKGSDKVGSRVELDFPVSRSWVRMDWQLDDPGDQVSEIILDVKLNLDAPTAGEPNLVDFGAGTWVYARLAPGQVASLQAKRSTGDRVDGATPWSVLKGTARASEAFVVSDPRRPTRSEGWVHLMDRKRCLALAVDSFGHEQFEAIETTAEGNVRVRRVFSRRKVRTGKSLRAWMHFVGFPPQQSAATSPRHMQTPPAIRILR
jgi:hypothetical protein